MIIKNIIVVIMIIIIPDIIINIYYLLEVTIGHKFGCKKIVKHFSQKLFHTDFLKFSLVF